MTENKNLLAEQQQAAKYTQAQRLAEHLYRTWWSAAQAEQETEPHSTEEAVAMAATLTAEKELEKHLDTHGLTGSHYDPREEA